MARADNTIRVNIIGDARKLVGAVNTADTATGGLVGSTARALGGVVVAYGAIRGVTGFLKDSTQEADRLGDATSRLALQLTPELAQRTVDMAGSFRDMGLSSQDVLELAANFSDIATAAGIADPMIAETASQVAAIGAAVSQLGDQSPEQVVDLIGKAAGGSTRAARDLGVTLLEGASASEQLTNILAQLAPKLDLVRDGGSDLEKQQRELQASVEELEGKIGGPLSEALAGVVGFINDEIDAIPGAIEGWQMLGGAIEQFGRDALGPIARVNDALGALGNLANDIGYNITHIGAGTAGRSSESQTVSNYDAWRERNGLPSTMGRP